MIATTELQAYRIAKAVSDNYDMMNDQDEWSALCDLLLEVIAEEATDNGYAANLIDLFPHLFTPTYGN